jgi:hypothetical protein
VAETTVAEVTVAEVTVAEVIRSILPLLERFGIATAAEVEVETLAQRLRQETIDNDVVWTAPPVMSAWTRRPAGAAHTT